MGRLKDLRLLKDHYPSIGGSPPRLTGTTTYVSEKEGPCDTVQWAKTSANHEHTAKV